MSKKENLNHFMYEVKKILQRELLDGERERAIEYAARDHFEELPLTAEMIADRLYIVTKTLRLTRTSEEFPEMTHDREKVVNSLVDELARIETRIRKSGVE